MRRLVVVVARLGVDCSERRRMFHDLVPGTNANDVVAAASNAANTLMPSVL